MGKGNNPKALVLADCLNLAVAKFLDENKNPGRKVMQIDNRGSHFYLALYWAEALKEFPEFADEFGPLYDQLAAKEEQIAQELIDCQGSAQDVGGYYHPNP